MAVLSWKLVKQENQAIMMISITQAILLLICFQGLIFAGILLIDNGPKKWSKSILAAFLLVLSAQMGNLILLDWIPINSFSERWACIYGFNYGPLLFLYALSLIYRDFRPKRVLLFHFVPSILLIILSVAGLSLCNRMGWLIYLALLLYVAAIIYRLIKYRKVVKATQSSTKSIELKWLQWMVLLFTLILLSDIVDQFVFSMDIYPGVSIVHLALLVLVVSMYVMGLRQPQLFLGIDRKDESLTANISTNQKFPVDESRLNLLEAHLEKENPFLDPQLSLQDLALQVQIPARQLSQLINQGMGKNFMTLINEKRIELAKRRLSDPLHKEKTVLEIMYAVGFNSKSSFNTLFKKQTGLTPTAYRRKFMK
ncbi:MAG: helix-turn-helix domain-containing protein [Bacteroidota bacterium]